MEGSLNVTYITRIAEELSVKAPQVAATAMLLAEGATVPFIARYRKEATGTLDEVQITSIRDRLAQMAELDARRAAIISSLEERKLLTDDLKAKVNGAQTMATLEDIYLPFRPKRRTRAMIAREKGLEPLADFLLKQDDSIDTIALTAEAQEYVKPAGGAVTEELAVPDVAAALAGARDIIAEKINDDADVRAKIRTLFLDHGLITSEVVPGKETEVAKYKDYFKWEEPIATAPSHRVLAIRRGAAEGFLFFRIAPDEQQALAAIESAYVRGRGPCSDQVTLAVKDCYKRLLSMSMETEARLESKKKADAAAIDVFAQNLRQLLLASPLGQKRVLAIDPGFRTGCKTVVLDAQGKLLYNDVIYPDQGDRRTTEAATLLLALLEKYDIEAIAIGNGTASRETETFVRRVLEPIKNQTSTGSVQGNSKIKNLLIVMVNESGASIYSASEAAREEFPDHDLTVRGAVSIGRRLMDPLAELVKLDPKSIGVGQYQHDVDQNLLKKSLDDVVISCVNAVGVEVNTASKQLLTYVSGLNATIAENIVKHRNENGPFKTRKDLLKVPRLGEKTFEQAAGFFRIANAENPLDSSAVHPESYVIVDLMAKDIGVTVKDLMRDESARKKIAKEKYVTEKVGLPTLTDIVLELAKPGRDPREQFEAFSFADGVNTMQDLKPGMKLPGIVTNITAFGCFVDIGVHQDGLVHISQLADRFVKDPNEVVKVAQKVEVTVVEVDLERKRIALTMRKGGAPAPRPENRDQPAAATRQPALAKPVAKPQPKPAGEGWFSAALKNAGKLK